MFVAIQNNGFFSVYLVNVSTMTKQFTSNVVNAEGIQVVSQEFLNGFNDISNKSSTLVNYLTTCEQLIKENQLRNQQKWNNNVNKVISVIDTLFKV